MSSFLKAKAVTHYVLFAIILISSFCLYGYVKNRIELNQARTVLTTMLKSSPYDVRVSRNTIIKEESGPFSGIIWYEYTFATSQTLAESKKYKKFLHQSSKNMTLKNCPIVYRVIVRPPTKKIKHWTGEIYLDTNQKLSATGRSNYVQALSDKSLCELTIS
ncbi:hypothetical protein [Lactiplantibacillus plantarum]|uniref:hypothetical protein n=1 Tax=Lactiplantibacillus plantarum TaxID=1590 RepID=UPI000CF89E75|nr:hypothetical protein [Lactiplantibacillus plantarum]MBO2717438.1 hypothetical protein [Lactiplantibacillus plantarum]SPD93954.1 hypothetical protein LAP8962_02659 [Lactiplantibacillus plantarum]VFI65143.1 hypothetical protein LAP9434_02693 [Lactiplantibacillus plantarum]VFQ57668.1 hypothetical protein LAP9435_2690 [Lactiplantibacillus plantarum]